MELRHLRYFVAVGEEQHYGRAAHRLGVAQPALSRQIQDLEREIGFKLFERLPRGVKLSGAGTLFLEDARRILQAVHEAAERASRVARGRSGTLRVGFTENASWQGVVPESFRRFGSCSRTANFSFRQRRVSSCSMPSGPAVWMQGLSSTW
jgi:DNA-binding transcriptional LysR family regulator